MRATPRFLGFLVCLLAGSVAFAGGDEDQPAPRFHARTTTGAVFTNENVKGKAVLLEFWTTWCPYCRQEERLVDEIQPRVFQ